MHRQSYPFRPLQVSSRCLLSGSRSWMFDFYHRSAKTISQPEQEWSIEFANALLNIHGIRILMLYGIGQSPKTHDAPTRYGPDSGKALKPWIMIFEEAAQRSIDTIAVKIFFKQSYSESVLLYGRIRSRGSPAEIRKKVDPAVCR